MDLYPNEVPGGAVFCPYQGAQYDGDQLAKRRHGVCPRPEPWSGLPVGLPLETLALLFLPRRCSITSLVRKTQTGRCAKGQAPETPPLM